MTNRIEPPDWAKPLIQRSQDRMTEAMRTFHLGMGGSDETFAAILAAQAIEARRAATENTGAVEDESAVPKECAQKGSA